MSQVASRKISVRYKRYLSLISVINSLINLSVTGATLNKVNMVNMVKMFPKHQLYVLICDALRNSVPFVQFKKHEKHPLRSVT